jgi:organic radical activating enzyme
MKYWVSEIFVSIQGEGEVIGYPSNFIRLAGCHLRCIWCDTKYSWLRSNGKLMSIEEILKNIDESIKTTTITGGEPLMQNILPLVRELKKLNHRIIVETSGTIRPNDELVKLVDVFSVSPKLSNAGFKINYDFTKEYWITYYKFVIVDIKKDLGEVKGFVEKNSIDPSKVILQPDGRRVDYINAIRELVDAVIRMKLPFRVLPQFHRIIDYK